MIIGNSRFVGTFPLQSGLIGNLKTRLFNQPPSSFFDTRVMASTVCVRAGGPHGFLAAFNPASENQRIEWYRVLIFVG